MWPAPPMRRRGASSRQPPATACQRPRISMLSKPTRGTASATAIGVPCRRNACTAASMVTAVTWCSRRSTQASTRPLPPATRDPGGMQQRRPRRQISLFRREITAPIAMRALEIDAAFDRRRVAGAHPRTHADAHPLALHAQAQVDPGNLRADIEPRRIDAQLAIDHLQLAQAFQRRERIAPGLLFARQSTHAPAPVVFALQRQFQPAQSQFGERAAGQQARVLRDQDFRSADRHRVRTVADAQAVQAQQRAASRPFGLDMVEADAAMRTRAQPGFDPFGMPLRPRQHELADHARDQCHRHQHDGDGIPRAAARQAQAPSQCASASARFARAGAGTGIRGLAIWAKSNAIKFRNPLQPDA